MDKDEVFENDFQLKDDICDPKTGESEYLYDTIKSNGLCSWMPISLSLFS